MKMVQNKKSYIENEGEIGENLMPNKKSVEDTNKKNKMIHMTLLRRRCLIKNNQKTSKVIILKLFL